MSTDQNNLRCRYYLHLIQLFNLAANNISQVLLVIEKKRLTLAEKGIKAELHQCLYWQSRLIALLAEAMQKERFVLTAIDGKNLRQINTKLYKRCQAFIQAANHGLNYLEQYFEHDFWLELSNDHPSICLSQLHVKMQDLLFVS